MEPLWQGEEKGKEVEWTDFGSNALFSPSQEEVKLEPSLEMEEKRENPGEQEIRPTKSSGRLRQKSMERRKQIGKWLA